MFFDNLLYLFMANGIIGVMITVFRFQIFDSCLCDTMGADLFSLGHPTVHACLSTLVAS